MKTNKKTFLKLLYMAVFYIIITATLNISYGYEITTIVTPKEELNTEDDPGFPEMVYRKQVSAYADTITKYKRGYDNKFNGTNYTSKAYPVAYNGWVYKRTLSDSEVPTDNAFTGINDEPHTNSVSFERIYEYFHRYQNSIYTTTKTTAEKNLPTRYYAAGELKYTDEPKETVMTTKKVWSVWTESEDYSGVYWQRATQTERSRI